MNIHELQKEVHAIAVEKGWHDKSLKKTPGLDFDVYPDRVLAKLALVHSELSEAEVEAGAAHFDVYFIDGKPEGWLVEIADALIRVLDMCEALKVPLSDFIPGRRHVASDTSLHGQVSRAVESVRLGHYISFAHALADLWVSCETRAFALQLDLNAAIKLKVAYNRTRQHRHGGKLA